MAQDGPCGCNPVLGPGGCWLPVAATQWKIVADTCRNGRFSRKTALEHAGKRLWARVPPHMLSGGCGATLSMWPVGPLGALR